MGKIKTLFWIYLSALCLIFLSACSKKSKLDPTNPVTLNMWHVYGEQVDSPMNSLMEEFNRTLGREKGVVVNVTLMSNAVEIGDKLMKAKEDAPGVPAMPDLFFCHNNNVQDLGPDNFIDWKEEFNKEEMDQFVPEFIEDGLIGEKLAVLPVSKSTHVLYIAGKPFQRFSDESGLSYKDLESWEGFFKVAEKYYEFSGGKPFCAIDYLLRCVDLNAMEKGADNFYKGDGWYDFNNDGFKAAFMPFAEALAKGHIVISDLYSNTQVMTGEVIAGIGSSASILYYNDTITYPDGNSEDMDLHVLPIPKAEGEKLLVSQAGVGLCAWKTTEQKAQAAAIFAKWLTESERNLNFCAETGYMPVNKGSYEKIKDYSFPSEPYQMLYEAIDKIKETGKPVREPLFADYFNKVHKFYEILKKQQSAFPERINKQEDPDKMAAEIWAIFRNIR